MDNLYGIEILQGRLCDVFIVRSIHETKDNSYVKVKYSALDV